MCGYITEFLVQGILTVFIIIEVLRACFANFSKEQTLAEFRQIRYYCMKEPEW
jgi:hypothetical protein